MSAAARPARADLRPNGPHSLYHFVRADVRERVRRYSFLVTLAFWSGSARAVYTGASPSSSTATAARSTRRGSAA